MVGMDGSPMTLGELAAKIEDVKYEIVTGPFPTFYDPMKAIYDELMKHGGNLDKVRAGMPKVNYVACELSSRAKEAWKKIAKDVKAESLFFSSDTLAKQLNHHPELTPEEYAEVFSGIKDYTGKIYDRGKGSIGFAIEVDGRYYRAILKPTINNLEVYLVSISNLNIDTLREFLNSKPIL